MKINAYPQQAVHLKEPKQAPEQPHHAEATGETGLPKKVDDVQWSAELREDQDRPQEAQAAQALAANQPAKGR